MSRVTAPDQFVSFGELLKYLRRREGLTQRELSIAVRYSDTQISRLEQNQHVPDTATLTALFLPALHIEGQPEWAARLLELAATTRKENVQRQAVELHAPATPSHNLSFQLTSFIGRKADVVRIKQSLLQHRLVSLTGVGGIGKTRLAIHCSTKLLGKFRDGIWWVDLAPLIDDALVPQAIAQVLGVPESSTQPLIRSVESFLHEKQLLLVLDNCEHLISASAQLAETLLTRCANLRILVTSREALGITGEVVYQVPTLSLPTSQTQKPLESLMEYEGVRLFVERAEARSGFRLTEQNATAVLQICQHLDGIPLALELAAARTELLSAEDIAVRLNDRFNLLRQGNRTALPRHQTLRAAIDWSHNLLTEPEQILFRRLAIFVGGFTLEAAEAVTTGVKILKSQVTDLVGQLINKSLVIVVAHLGGADADIRYGMLETIREYARQKLNDSGEMAQLQGKHCDFFIEFAERAEPKLKGAEQLVWLDRLELERDNWRAAWAHAIESDAELALRLASALLDFWYMRGNPSEGHQWLAELLGRTNQWGQTARRAHVLGIAGRLAHIQDDFALAQKLLEESLTISRRLGDKREIAFALQWLGWTLVKSRNDDLTAQAITQECLTIYQELQDQWGLAMAMFHVAGLAQFRGDYVDAQKLGEKSLAKFQELGDKFSAGYVLNGLGELARRLGDYERAGIYYEKSLEILQEERSRVTPASPMFNLAWVLLYRGDHQKAKALFKEVLNLFREEANQYGMRGCLLGFAGLLAVKNKPREAARLFGAMESLLEDIGMVATRDPSDQKEFNHYMSVIHTQLDEATFASAWAEGRAMTLEQAITFALGESDA